MIIGHKTIIADLQKLVERDQLGHGYIFVGSSMLGKRTVALALAHFLETGVFDVPADGYVLQDIKVIDGAFMKTLNPDMAGDSIGIDAVREIKNFLWQKPNISKRRTLIIDNAELLTTAVKAISAQTILRMADPKAFCLMFLSLATNASCYTKRPG